MHIVRSWLLFLLLLCGLAVARRGRGRSSSRGRSPEKEAKEFFGNKAAAASTDTNGRTGKLFSMFTIVQFTNEPCSSTSTIRGGSNRNGTCLTSSECSNRGGMIAGNCAASFGACCVFIMNENSGTVTQNCTYIQSRGFPGPMDATALENIMYTVRKCRNDVCTLRLDFESFTLLGTGQSDEEIRANAANDLNCDDIFRVTTSSGQLIPDICGMNDGGHMYVELGNEPGDTATLAWIFDAQNMGDTRMFEIKVTQIECDAPLRPPDSCLQYVTGTTGRIQTFNFDNANEAHLPNQLYSICIRKEEGFCCVQYQVCAMTDNAFTPTVAKKEVADVNNAGCMEDFIVISGGTQQCIPGSRNQPIVNRFCGSRLNFATGLTENVPVCDCSEPFSVGISFNDMADGGGNTNVGDTVSRGVCLDYRQVPC